MERKRVHFNTVLAAGAPVTTTNLVATIDESNGVNVYNIHIEFGCEPDSTDANGHGTWVLWCLPDEASNIPSSTISALEAEQSNAFLWAAGLWFASNQTPFNSYDIPIRTTRNCQNGARLVLSVVVEGLTAGSTRVTKKITYNTASL